MKHIFGVNTEKESYVTPAMEIYEFPAGSDVFLTLSSEETYDNDHDAGGLFNGANG